MELKGAKVLVTGASRGIGESIARQMAAAGAQVAVAARSESALSALAVSIGGKAFAVDLTDPDAVSALIPRVEAEFGPIDVLVNNAGLESIMPLDLESDASIRAVTRLNLEAPMVLTRHVLGGMKARGTGHIVFTSSLAGSAPFPAMSVYCATKAGLNNFVAAVRLELRGTAIGTTLVAPGPVDTSMWDRLEGEGHVDEVLKRFRMLQLIPKKSPEFIARKTVAAVAANRRHVRTPRRLSAVFWLGEAPRRLNEMLLTGAMHK
jgi:uncharacterized protein